MKFEHLHFVFTFPPPLLLRVFCKKRRATRKTVFDGREGSGNMKCIHIFNMHYCRGRGAAERGNRSVKNSERMLQHAVTGGKLFHCIPNDSTVSYASSNKPFCCLPSITTKVPTYTLLEQCRTSRSVFDICNKVIMS